jgi:RHS repeat-associated protein
LLNSQGPSADENPFRFSSEYFDQETGLVYYNFRYYSPELGRWLSRDPIKEQGGMNLYGMVGNDIINLTDINGLVDFTYHKSYIDEVNQLGGIGFIPSASGRVGSNIAGKHTFNVNYKKEVEYWDKTSWTYDPDWLVLVAVVNLTEAEKNCEECHISIYSIETNVDSSWQTRTSNFNVAGAPDYPPGNSVVTDSRSKIGLDVFYIYHLAGFQGDYVYVRAFRLEQLGAYASVTFIAKCPDGTILLNITVNLSR